MQVVPFIWMLPKVRVQPSNVSPRDQRRLEQVEEEQQRRIRTRTGPNFKVDATTIDREALAPFDVKIRLHPTIRIRTANAALDHSDARNQVDR